MAVKLPLRLIALVSALGVALSLRGESPFDALTRRTHPAFKVHAQRAPFPSDLVSALALDQDGSLWAGTVAGLARYDGRGWQPVAGPVPAWRLWVNNNALGVLEDGTLWCGTRTEGLLLHRRGQWTRLGRAEGLPSQAVNALLESRRRDRDGKRILYVGTYGGGLARRVEGRWETLDERQGLPGNQIFCLAEDPEDRLWVGTNRGVAILEGGTFRPFPAQAELPDPDVRTLLWTRDAAGQPELWLGPLRGGPCVWSSGRLVRHPIASKGVSGLIPARGGGVWVSFWGDGLARWDGHHWQSWKREDGLPSAQLRCLAEVEEDGRSVLWIGSDGRGVFRTAETGWRQFQPPWTGELEVRAVMEGPGGDAWIAGRNFGLLRFSGGAWRRWDLPEQPITGDIRCLAWWRGQLWAGCDLELLRLGAGGLEAGAPGTSLVRRIIRTLAATPERLWVGTSTGLVAWDGARAEGVWLPGGPGSGSVRSLALAAGDLWVGTDGGLFRREGAGPFQPVAGFSEGEGILALLGAGEDLWIGTSAGRILRWRGGALEVLAQGEERWAIQGLALDAGAGHLLASTTRGVERWDPRTGKRLGHYTMDDGLPDDTCTPGALLCDSSGRIWVGTGNGIGVFDPSRPATRSSAKRLVLEGAFTDSGPRGPGGSLPRGDHWLQVDFALRAHHREEDTRYRTQLLPVEGAPGGWSPEGHRRLQALPRGSYVLRIWARDYQGMESGPLDFPFRIPGRPWEHPLFSILAGLALIGAGGLAMRARTRARERELESAVARATERLVKQKEGLEELARQQREIMGIVAHDVRNPLSGIALMAEALEEEPEEAERLRGLRRVRGAVDSVTELLNQFLTLQSMETGSVALNLAPVPVVPLLEQVLETFRPQADRKGQVLQLEVEPVRVNADPTILREVLSNFLSNALKYSAPGTRVTVRAGVRDPGWIRLAVQDQGPGLSEADQARLFQRFTRLSARPTGGEHSVGLGLAICKRWMEAMGGRIGAESVLGEGATFWVELPDGDLHP